jgi:hypothetical protein
MNEEGDEVQSEIRSFVDAAWPFDPLEQRGVRRWRAAGRAMLLALLAFSALQYYFIDVHLTIMALPRVTWLAAQP